jgi:hypothetical protein
MNKVAKRSITRLTLLYPIPECLQLVETVVVDVVISKGFKVEFDPDLLSILLLGTAKIVKIMSFLREA